MDTRRRNWIHRTMRLAFSKCFATHQQGAEAIGVCRQRIGQYLNDPTSALTRTAEIVDRLAKDPNCDVAPLLEAFDEIARLSVAEQMDPATRRRRIRTLQAREFEDQYHEDMATFGGSLSTIAEAMRRENATQEELIIHIEADQMARGSE